LKKIILVLILICSYKIEAQFEATAGMGFDFINSPVFTDYVNVNYALSGEKLSSMNSAIEFYGEIGYNYLENYNFAIDYSNQIYSFNNSTMFGNYDISYTYFKPSIVAYYQIVGYGYKFKFGAGVGPRFVSLDEKLPGLTKENNFTATGYGFLLRLTGNTLLSGDMYANIGLDLRYDMAGELKGDYKLYNNVLNESVNLNSLTFAIKLGVTYIF